MTDKQFTPSAYALLLKKAYSIIKKKGFNIKVTEDIYLGSQEDQQVVKYDFKILDGDTIVTALTCYYSEGQVIKGVTRNAYENQEDERVFNITWVVTYKKYEGQGLGLLIIIYSICHLKNIYINTEYVILDDDSDNSSKIKNNMYNKLEFYFKGFQSLKEEIGPNDNPEDEPTEIVMTGPEKQLKLGVNFITRAKNILDNILKREKEKNTLRVSSRTRVLTTRYKPYSPYVSNKSSQSAKMPVKKGGKQKYTIKELKDIAIKNKIKITKKLNEKKVPLNKKDLIKKLKRYKLL
jgi:hypothetical protein